jgi:TRAP-type C4-dicarboxylate transport system substrate-binding protein
MKNRKLSFLSLRVIVVVLVSLVVFAGCAAPAPGPAPKVYEWKIQSVWARGDLSMETLAYFAERAYERSNGQLKIEVFAEPELVPLPEVFPACSTGALDMAQGGGAIWSMVVPCGDVVFGSVPRLWDFPDLSVEDGAKKQRQFLFESGAVDILRREYAKHNLYWLDMHTAGSVCHLSTKEVHTLADIKGLKIADLGGWMAQWHAALGWVPVEMLPASDMEMALRLGTIDCLDWDLSAIAGFGWHKVAPYWVSNEGMVTHILQDMLVNMDSWNALPDDLKQALAGAALDYFDKCNDVYGEQEEIVREKVNAGEIIECLMDEGYQRAADEAAYEVWDKAAAEDPASAELIQLIKEFRGIE